MIKFKSGFVTILGFPNVGKSTLMNSMLGERLSIVTPKPQTTRKRILGILTESNFQIIFSDTPGYILKPTYLLQKKMNQTIMKSLEDADILLMMTQPDDDFFPPELMEKIQSLTLPKFVVLNKIDLLKPEQTSLIRNKWTTKLPEAFFYAISALHGTGLLELKNAIVEHLPEHPPYYADDVLSDRYIREFVAEFIREQIFLLYKQEIPYHSEVVIEEFKEDLPIPHIRAIIYVSRESIKKIIIGEGGKSIKELGIRSRKRIEEFLNHQIYLELHVKVMEWRNNDKKLKQLGY
ncbi:MAG: GTPase Era [Bacteroidales bacterium]|nr:GTPase Era [Bacteroidales bacterium]